LTALTYFFCYLDRINVGFAALTMNKEIGLDAAIYGMAAGAFFWATSSSRCRATSSSKSRGAVVDRADHDHLGPHLGATAFATGPYSFMTIRFLLGLARPGCSRVSCFISPTGSRTAIAPASTPASTLALPIAVATGAPISNRAPRPRRAVGP